MAAVVIVLNGISSAGKSTIARRLQEILPDPWLALGVDDLIDAMPASLVTSAEGIPVDANGIVSPGPAFRRLEAAWMRGVAAMARTGARVILDEVFLGGARSRERWLEVLRGQEVLWVGVHCDLEVAEARERARGDRVVGMAKAQWPLVHRGIVYDLEVDTTSASALQCAQTIAHHAAGAPGV